MAGRPMGYGGASLSITPQDAVVATFGALASDGIDGDFTVAVGTTFTPGRDYYFNNLLVDGTYDARGHRIFARKITISATGIIHSDGASAVGSLAGAAFTQGALPPNIAGVNGGTGVAANGNAANAVFRPRNGVLSTQYRGGAGGTSAAPGTVNAGGTAGTISLASTSRVPRSNPVGGLAASHGAFVTITPASSGGAGGGDGTNQGGGSGAGGGYGYLLAGEVINNGIIRALGGNGGNAAGGNAGGGGGGGGGVWECTVGKWTGSFPVCTGGTGGAKAGNGVAGSNGNDGEYFINTFKAA